MQFKLILERPNRAGVLYRAELRDDAGLVAEGRGNSPSEAAGVAVHKAEDGFHLRERLEAENA